MMETSTKIPLVSSEITGLWSSYMSDTMIVCVLKYYLSRVDDSEIRSILQKTCDQSIQHVDEVAALLIEAGLPVPDGYSDTDVNTNAPRLFTDAFYLQYLGYISRAAMHNYTLILNQIARSDMIEYFSKRIYEYIDLYKISAQLRLDKGIFVRAPRVEVTKDVHYVKSESFIMDWFGEKRPLLTKEITHIFGIIFAYIVGRAITTGFGQVSEDKKKSDYFFEGKHIASKQIGELTSLLTDEGIPIPSSSDSYVTDSKVAPFSEKLMLSHSVVLSSYGISSLGMAMSDSMRGDLQTKYMKFFEEDIKYGKKGADIMIANGFLEQPPQAIKHENLIGV